MLIGICEDNPVIREELIQEIQKQQTGVTIQLHAFSSGEAMLQSNLAFDLVFLDIELEGELTGLEVAQILQNQLPDIILIFISGYTKYITSALHLHTFQFLLKPLDAQLFQEEFRRCVAQYRSAHDIFQIPQNREVIEVEMKDIVYIESNKRKLIVHHKNGKIFEMYGKISEQESYLAEHFFVRIHKSFLVNCRYIKKFQDEVVQLGYAGSKELLTLPVSRRCKKHAQEQYHRYFFEV